MRPHEKLDVWKKSIDVTIAIYRVSDAFPKEERFGLTSQLRRASVSIAANIADGAARKTRKEFINFLSIAQGSASEVETELLIALKLGYCDDEIYNKLISKLDEIGRMLTGLSIHLRGKEDYK